MIRILQLDSGGSKGIAQATALKEMEKELGVPLYELFDLIIGSSVGAILGGVLATGKVNARELNDIVLDGIYKIFAKEFRIPILQPLYSRKPFYEIFNDAVGKDFLMNECVTKFICTAVSKVDGRTHFFKSWEEKDGKLKLIDAISRSYAAPYYFGKIVDKVDKQVWVDGAAGDATSTLIEALIEAIRQKWLHNGEHVHILSIGTGRTDIGTPYPKAKKGCGLSDILFYWNLGNGGLSRVQSVESRNNLLVAIDENYENLSFNRIDINLPKKMNAMDKLEYIPNYQEFGKEMAKQIDLNYFK